MKAGFIVLILCFTLYHHGRAANECGCGVRHPQVRYCNSTFAMIFQIHDKVESNLPFAKVQYFKDYMKFNVTVLEVFKPKEIESALLDEEFTTLWTAASFCGVPELDIIETYVISGYFHHITDPATGDSIPLLMANRCGLTLKMDDVTTYQMRGLTQGYQEQCNQCRPVDVYGELTHNHEGEIESELFDSDVRTKFWTLDVECFYNPASSMHQLVRDCESEVSICKRDPQTSKCSWDLNNDFMECFKQRGMSVSYRHNANSAAVSRPSDCKYLQSKKLKKKCIRNFRKKYSAKRKQKKRRNRQH